MATKVGLFFGSFNPIHIGHLIIANTIREKGNLDEVWFVVSPQNPFKSSKSLLHEFDRIDMVREAIADNYHLQASDIEFSLPKPSYTIDTLERLIEKYPEKQFELIMGQDNLAGLSKWKNYEKILQNHDILVYPRPGSKPNDFLEHPAVRMVEAPLLAISATYIRKAIKDKQSIKYLVADKVIDLIESRKYYQ